MSSLTASSVVASVKLLPHRANTWMQLCTQDRFRSPYNLTVKAEGQCKGRTMLVRSCPVGLCAEALPFGRKKAITTHASRKQSASLICATAALNARCGAEQTQTVTRESSTITIAPVDGKEKSPDLDDGGDGFPPRDDGDGGGGGGGGGNWSGGFFFFGFLAFLGFLKDQENEGPYRDDRRR